MAKHRKASRLDKALARLKANPRGASRGITGFAVVLGLLITTLVWLFYLPGRHTHEQLQTEQTRLRLVFQPHLVQGYLSSLAPGATRDRKSVV